MFSRSSSSFAWAAWQLHFSQTACRELSENNMSQNLFLNLPPKTVLYSVLIIMRSCLSYHCSSSRIQFIRLVSSSSSCGGMSGGTFTASLPPSSVTTCPCWRARRSSRQSCQSSSRRVSGAPLKSQETLIHVKIVTKAEVIRVNYANYCMPFLLVALIG